MVRKTDTRYKRGASYKNAVQHVGGGTGYRVPGIRYRVSGTGYRVSGNAGCWLLVAGCWLLINGLVGF